MFNNKLHEEHAGKHLIAFDIGTGCSPSFELIAEPDTLDPKALAEQLTQAIQSQFDSIPAIQKSWVFKPVEVTVHSRTRIIETPEENEQKWKKLFERTPEEQEAERKRQEEWERKNITENPDNGKTGIWQVSGYETKVLVSGVSSAAEAREKAQPHMKSWADDFVGVSVEFFGTELPEIFVF